MQEGRKGHYEPQRIPRLFESKRVHCVSRVSADQSQRGMTCGVAYLSKMKEASPAFCSPHFFVIEKLIRLFELTIRAQLLFTTVLQKPNQGA
jgi:hypothetical protein